MQSVQNLNNNLTQPRQCWPSLDSTWRKWWCYCADWPVQQTECIVCT